MVSAKQGPFLLKRARPDQLEAVLPPSLVVSSELKVSLGSPQGPLVSPDFHMTTLKYKLGKGKGIQEAKGPRGNPVGQNCPGRSDGTAAQRERQLPSTQRAQVQSLATHRVRGTSQDDF